MGGGKWNDKATPLYANLSILKQSDLVQLHKPTFIFNFKSNKLPSTFKKYFEVTSNIHGKNTESSSLDNLILPYYRTNKLQKSIKFRGPKVWNSTETSIKQSKSPKIFKENKKVFHEKILELRACELINNPIHFAIISLPVVRSEEDVCYSIWLLIKQIKNDYFFSVGNGQTLILR